MKYVKTSPLYEQVRQELVAVIKKYAEQLTPLEMLAMASVLVGQLIALQDQSLYTPEAIMDMVGDNIETGNRQAIQDLANRPTEGKA